MERRQIWWFEELRVLCINRALPLQNCHLRIDFGKCFPNLTSLDIDSTVTITLIDGQSNTSGHMEINSPKYFPKLTKLVIGLYASLTFNESNAPCNLESLYHSDRKQIELLCRLNSNLSNLAFVSFDSPYNGLVGLLVESGLHKTLERLILNGSIDDVEFPLAIKLAAFTQLKKLIIHLNGNGNLLQLAPAIRSMSNLRILKTVGCPELTQEQFSLLVGAFNSRCASQKNMNGSIEVYFTFIK